MFTLMNHLLNNIGYIIAAAFLFTKIKSAIESLRKEERRDHIIYVLFFSALAIAGTYIGLDYKGSILNTRNIGVITGGLLLGPQVGILAGIFSALHRILIPIGEATEIPCAIATVLAGVFSGYLHNRYRESAKPVIGFFLAIIVESISMILILVFSSNFKDGLDIVKSIYFPMSFMNSLGVYALISIIQNTLSSMEVSAGKQAKIALEIANKTLPYFQKGESLDSVCKIILESLEAKAVAITDLEKIRASYVVEGIPRIEKTNIQSPMTRKVLELGKIMVFGKNNREHLSDYLFLSKEIKSCIILPLLERGKVSGALKIFFDTPEKVTANNRYLAIGLSQLISTQLELEKLDALEDSARKAELKALYSQINPHFLFNVLNTIASFVRIDPNKAREVIIDLSTYLRYNLENSTKFVSLREELEQVRAFVALESARFGDKIKVHYQIEEETLGREIPSLSIQPLVENSIIHGLLPKRQGGNIWISAKIKGEETRISIQDDGLGIPEKVIHSLEEEIGSSIGLKNVHHRLKLIYGKGLLIERLLEGTKISFSIYRQEVDSI